MMSHLSPAPRRTRREKPRTYRLGFRCVPLAVWSAGLTIALALAVARPAHGLVISEIHYHPVGEGADGGRLEFVEIANDSTTPEDLSGFRFSEGIEFEFPPQTILLGRSYIVVCADVDAVRAEYGIDNAIGNFTGRLDSSGERLTLVSRVGVEVVSVSYRDEGKWPVAPDGTGHTLVLRSLRSDPSEPESWRGSPEIGGSPGAPNLPETGAGGREDVVLIGEGDLWRFARGDAPFSSGEPAWYESEFDDAAWSTGAAGFGYGDGDDATELGDMRDGYGSVACRATFELTNADVERGKVRLSIRYDDGFCAFVNGAEFARANCPDTIDHDSTATGGHEASDPEEFEVPPELLREGTNHIAVVGYNVTVDSTDFSLAPSIVLERLEAPPTEETVMFNELHRSVGNASWVELFNPGASAIDLSGYKLATEPNSDGFSLGADTKIAAQGFLTITDEESGLDLSSPEVRVFLRDVNGLVVAAFAFDRDPPAEFADESFSEALFPDGGTKTWITPIATRGEPNRVDRATAIVINEIFYQPPEDRSGEFVEIYNRESSSVDLTGYRFERGIDFEFSNGTLIGPGEYLVVAKDPPLIREIYGIENVVGPYDGKLSNRGENLRLVDSRGNIADEVRYFDGGTWSRWADGGGASLELIDPEQRNDVGVAWAASDESEKADWERLSYQVDDYVPARETELHLFLVARGECLIDDVSVRRGAGDNHIPNPGFEDSTSPWRIEGTHIDSRRVTWDAHSGEACLELVASGKGDSSVNRIEIDASPRLTSGPYEVSLWARWLRGASVIVGHGEFTAGPWGGRPAPSVNQSGNTLGGKARLTVPRDLGTPGRENTARARLRDETGSTNLGPLIWAVTHSPATPESGDPVTVSARIDDADGVASVTVLYREGNANGPFERVPLTRSPGRGLDAVDGPGEQHRAELPGFSARDKIVFYLEATDATGRTSRFPATAPAETLLFMVSGPQESDLDSVAIALDDARTAELSTRRLHSNHLLHATYIFNDREIRYNVGIRYRGSPWGRPERSSYRVRFEEDARPPTGLGAVNLSSRVDGAAEKASYYLSEQAGTPEKPVSVPIYRFVRTTFNGGGRRTQRFIQPVDNTYLRQWFPDSDGPGFKAVARLAFNDRGERTAYDGASFDYMNENSENYRFYYMPFTNRNRDEWEDLTRLMRLLDPRATDNDQHDAEIESILDVEGFLRTMVARVFVSDWDTLGIGQGHNAYLYLDSRDSRWETIPFDFNQAMPTSQVSYPVFPTFDRGWRRLIARPKARRLYVRIAREFLDTAWSIPAARPYLDAVEDASRVSFAGVRSFISARARVIEGAIRPLLDVDFEISTNDGANFSTEAASVELTGTASAAIASILVERNGAEAVELTPSWSTPIRWTATFDTSSRTNAFELSGIDGADSRIASTSIEITNTSQVAGFVRGDSNGDGEVAISDAVKTLLYLFVGDTIDCEDAADANDDGRLNLVDPVGTLEYLFQTGAPPPAPFPTPGEDTTPDELGCTRG